MEEHLQEQEIEVTPRAKELQFMIKMRDQQLFERAKRLIDDGGFRGRRAEWLATALSVMESGRQQSELPEYADFIQRFGLHTQRLNEIFIEFTKSVSTDKVELHNTLQKHRDEVVHLKAALHEAEARNQNLQQAIAELESQYTQQLSSLGEEHEEKRKHLNDRIEELQREQDKNQTYIQELTERIAEYKERIVEKDREVQKYAQVREEKEVLRQELHHLRETHSVQVEELRAQLHTHAEQLRDQQRAFERVELEKDKEMLQQERAHQQKIQQANEDYHTKVREMLEQHAALAQSFEAQKQQDAERIRQLEKQVLELQALKNQ